MKLEFLDWVAFVLVIAGGLNWGWVGLNGFDLISRFLGPAVGLFRYLNMAIGLSAIYLAVVVLPRATKNN